MFDPVILRDKDTITVGWVVGINVGLRNDIVNETLLELIIYAFDKAL